MNKPIYLYLVLLLLMLAAHSVQAEEIFIDDRVSQGIIAPTSPRWAPGYDGGICTSSMASASGLCGPGSFTEQAVWGALLAPSLGATVDTDLTHYSDRGLTPLPFEDFLWITKPGVQPFDLYSHYFYSNAVVYTGALYLQFNSAFDAGFHCTDFLVPTSCGQPHTLANHDGVVTAGYVLWSDGNFDQITFWSLTAVPEPSSLLLLTAGFVLLLWRCRKIKPQVA